MQDPNQGQHMEDGRPGYHPRTCAQKLRWWAWRWSDWHLQHLPQSGHRPQMLQNIHYNTSSKEISCVLSEQPPPRHTDTNCDEVFWAACQTTHHNQPPCITWPTPVCLSSLLLHRGCNIHHFALSRHSSGPERHLRQNPVHWFNTITPQRLMEKLLLLGLNKATCLLIRDFLTDCLCRK